MVPFVGRKHRLTGRAVGLVLAAGLVLAPALRANDIDAPPICYNSAKPNNVIERLQARIEKGETRLAFDAEHGYLEALLKELNVPRASQVLVFSKTSLQRHRIGPKTPRAIYFHDDLYVGFCLRGDVVELSAVDPILGTVFYTLDQSREERPKITRQNDACLICHGSSSNQGFPGHLVRSVYPDPTGLPVLSAGSHRIDHTSPIRDRWGGWYVTGQSGKQTHLGNLIVRDGRRPDEGEMQPGTNVTDLKDRFTVGLYLEPTSDLIALMVMEHQAEGHNRITRANYLTRMALHDEAEIAKALGKPSSERSPGTQRRIQSATEPLLKYLLFSGEIPLREPVQGVSSFARDFAQTGPRDAKNRSLRELDLKTRLFRYPCSYLITSAAFAGLPVEARTTIYRRLREVLQGQDKSADFAHLSAADRETLREMLPALLPELAEAWKASPPSATP